ncbi:MAG TPA: hypothetical protein VH917_02430, partial [Ignavibacteriaceae bacterium]
VVQFDAQKYKARKDWFIKEIEERLRERAGNLPLKDSYSYSREAEIKETKPKNIAKLGTGISEDEVKKIIAEFK